LRERRHEGAKSTKDIKGKMFLRVFVARLFVVAKLFV